MLNRYERNVLEGVQRLLEERYPLLDIDCDGHAELDEALRLASDRIAAVLGGRSQHHLDYRQVIDTAPCAYCGAEIGQPCGGYATHSGQQHKGGMPVHIHAVRRRAAP